MIETADHCRRRKHSHCPLDSGFNTYSTHAWGPYSRWRLLFGFARKIRSKFRKNKHVANDKGDLDDLGFFGCCLIGVLHGIGVESPTQLLALGSAAAIGNLSVGLTLISVFSVGMVLSNMAIAWVSIFGFQNARRRKTIFFCLSLVSAILSAAIGIKLLLA